MSTVRGSRGVTRLTGVTYDSYVAIRDAPGNRGYRMAYHDGVLEIMSPEFRHEKGGRRLAAIVREYTVSLRVACQAAGSTTFRQGRHGLKKGKGKEPDESFYLGDAEALVRGRNVLVLGVDPPPSLWIEVDNRAGSAGRLPHHAALCVPEVWRYRPRARRLWFGRLAGESYTPLDESVALLGLTPGLVLGLLDEAESVGETAWLVWLRDEWFPSHRHQFKDKLEGST